METRPTTSREPREEIGFLAGGNGELESLAVSSEHVQESDVVVDRGTLLLHRGNAMNTSPGAAPLKGEQSHSVHANVARTISDPVLLRMLKWKLVSSSKYVKRHFKPQLQYV